MIFLFIISAILFGLLMVPIELIFEVDNNPARNRRVRLIFLFGLTSLTFNESNEQSPKKEKIKQREKRSFNFSFTLIRNPIFRKSLFNCIRLILSAFKIKTGNIILEIGLDNPCDTGELIGDIYALQYSIEKLYIPTFKLQVIGNYQREVIEWCGDLKIKILPIYLLGAFLSLILSPTMWRSIYAAKIST